MTAPSAALTQGTGAGSMKHATLGITRPMQLDNGRRFFKCRNARCRRAGQWLHESEFYRLANPLSRCGRFSECKACNDARRARQKWADREVLA
jgi:hypothetical protein